MELATSMIRIAAGATGSGRAPCDHCARTPLAGETVHVLSGGAAVCALCLPAVPAEGRATARVERVRAGARRVQVLPRAA